MIQKVIRDYFDKRYQSRHANQVEDFRPLLDNSPQANSFLELETDKLEIEIYNAKIHHQKYTQYEYTLDFNDFVYDLDDQRATVHLAEGYNVVFEISELISKNDPIVSKMRNLQHMITLKKYEDEWKIVSDIYDDNLWRLLREANISKDELLTMIDDVSDQKSDPSPMEYPTTWCNLPYDESSHSYNREGAVAYAHQYAENPNPAYYYFPDTDCTNFINQQSIMEVMLRRWGAIHMGGITIITILTKTTIILHPGQMYNFNMTSLHSIIIGTKDLKAV